jgi:uncharacterized membrane protein
MKRVYGLYRLGVVAAILAVMGVALAASIGNTRAAAKSSDGPYAVKSHDCTDCPGH